MNDKQIEEMAKDLANCIDYDEWSAREYGEYHIDFDFTANRLYEQGYCKIDEGSVVITKAEYNWLVSSDKEEIVKENEELGNQCLEWMELYHKQVTKTYQARTQAVKEVLEKTKEKCKELEDKFSHLCKSKKECLMETCRYEGVLAVKRELNEIAKEFGVEL